MVGRASESLGRAHRDFKGNNLMRINKIKKTQMLKHTDSQVVLGVANVHVDAVLL